MAPFTSSTLFPIAVFSGLLVLGVTSLRKGLAIHAMPYWAISFMRDRFTGSRFVFPAILAIAIISLCTGALLRDWQLARTFGPSLAGYLPISDAQGYLGCAERLLATGEVPSGCERRPTYSSILASFLGMSNWHLHIALLLQAVVLALAFTVLIREIVLFIGLLGGLVALLPLLLFAMKHAIPMAMTENAGLAFGAVALALLLRGARTDRSWTILAGIATLGLALSARPGALLILPMLVLWVGIEAHRAGRSVLRAFLSATGAALFGLALQLIISFLYGAGLENTQSNFAEFLYKLSTGGARLRRVADHPQIARKSNPAAQAVHASRELQLVARFIGPGTNYLEIGAGDCSLAFAVAGKVIHVYAIDVSDEISKQIETPANFELIISDGISIPVPAGSIDFAYSNQLMEHLHPDDAESQLENVFTALRPGGVSNPQRSEFHTTDGRPWQNMGNRVS